MKQPPSASKTYRKMLVTTDLSEPSLTALDEAGRLARESSAEVTLLFVVEDHLPPILGVTAEEERHKVLERQASSARQHLETLVQARLGSCEVSLATRIGVPAPKIVQYAKDADIDLIVMASHGYGPLRQLLLGSTTERVLHRAPCPVLVVPSGDRH